MNSPLFFPTRALQPVRCPNHGGFPFSLSPVPSSTLPQASTAPKSYDKHVSPSPTSIRFRRLRLVFAASASYDRNILPRQAPTEASLYEVLGISVRATDQEEIKAAYRRLARTFHTDLAAGGKESSAADMFIRIHSSYSTLIDSEKRVEYDQKIYQRLRRHGPFSGMSASDPSIVCRYPNCRFTNA
ncbi:hypothetical protein Nepgr_026399 [Nepenthes gracilis]|uniref:J domain-containing protein n=1 Tax=Nepenthes gracilis TaxID=150966 RepID=A0AAD3Y2F6_NEPGR|nr:hypothetical protein Nepgr_026399 [Nepenthes gracilis]